MIVRQSSYETLKRQHYALVRAHDNLIDRYNNLIDEWNGLVQKINERGGKAFLDGQMSNQQNTQFTPDELRTLLSLCHPDKHGGKESATRVTQKLIAMREAATQ